MKKLIAIALSISLGAVLASAQATGTTDPVQNVSVAAKGDDVRTVLTNLFTQAKKNFVIQPNIHFALYLQLADMPFDETLQIVLKTASLSSRKQNGIYYISKAAPEPVKVEQKTTKVEPVKPAAVEEVKPHLPWTAMRKKISLKLNRTELSKAVTDLAKQSGATIEIDPLVPNYKIDAFFKSTTLKYALDKLTLATGLTYHGTTKGAIRIEPNKDHVALSADQKG